MQLHMKGQNLFLTPAVIQRIERRLGFALSRFADRIDRVSVRLPDINGLRGGVDKQCRIVVTLRPGRQIVIEDTDAALETAVGRAADRAQRSVARAIGRMREPRNRHTCVPTESKS